MPLFLQDPDNAASATLLQCLLAASQGATSGAASFAWATGAGLRLLLEAPQFQSFAAGHPFDLVIGADAVTSERALKELSRITAQKTKISGRVFLHDRAGFLFHPKVSWFRHANGGTLITGSGNLTSSGLQTNWEAFHVLELDITEMQQVVSQWTTWIGQHAAKFYAPDSPRALAQAAKNKGWEGARVPRVPPATNTAAAAPIAAVPLTPDLEVLIAEIPRGGARWGQANFKKIHYEQFFGAIAGGARTVLEFRLVGSNGTVGPIALRPSIEVGSSNFRFELEAPRIPYPVAGRPIGVYVPNGIGKFLYSLLLPGDVDYAAVSNYLDIVKERASVRALRAGRTDLESLIDIWPSAPFWNIPGILP